MRAKDVWHTMKYEFGCDCKTAKMNRHVDEKMK